ncbi:MAG: aminoacyl-histidine dipeptidase [Candidatus Cryptobacteroides sp.]
MMTIKELDPQIVWRNFYALTRIPRPSKNEGKAAEYLYEFGMSLGLETIKDEIGNVIIRKPATPGMENRKGVILQGHIDMVPQKNADVVHDFDKDPIETYIDGDWVRAKGTTLGADNGLGVAMAMAVIESKDLKHGPIEVLVTVDEETGMTGAQNLKPGLLSGDILINLDSETEGEFCIGCAGGLDFTGTADCPTQDKPQGWLPYELSVKRLRGGHSGIEIILDRANANKAVAYTVYALMKEVGVKLVSFKGGTLRNAIPREAFATLYVAPDKVEAAKAVVDNVFSALVAEYKSTDPLAEVHFEPSDGQELPCLEDAAALKLIQALIACPDGVEKMSASVSGLVETSNNLAVVSIEGGHFEVRTLMRSSVDLAKEALALKIRSIFELAGVEVSFTGGYSGWAPNASSEILSLMKDLYKEMFGKEPSVMAIHAGLECGILAGAYPHWDMISCGPTLESPHSPDERANIPSVSKMWYFLKAVLEAIPVK